MSMRMSAAGHDERALAERESLCRVAVPPPPVKARRLVVYRTVH